LQSSAGNNIGIGGQARAVRILPRNGSQTPAISDPVYGAGSVIFRGGYPCRWNIGGLGTFEMHGPIWVPCKGDSISFIGNAVGDAVAADLLALGPPAANQQFGMGFAYYIDVAHSDQEIAESDYNGAIVTPDSLDGLQTLYNVPSATALAMGANAFMSASSKLTATIQNRGPNSIFVSVLPFSSYLTPLVPTAAAVAASGFEILGTASAGNPGGGPGSITITVPRGNLVWATCPGGLQVAPANCRVNVSPFV
jgi:hypothetical protein